MIDEVTQGPAGITVAVNLSRMRRVGARLSLSRYIAALWGRRQFIMFDARARVQSANDNDRLGSLWLILTPILNGMTYFFMFGILLGTSRGIENFLGYLVIGVFTFQMSSSSISQGARSITANQKVIQAFNFPRAALPLAVNLRVLLSSIPATIAMLLIIIVAAPIEEITWRWLLILPAILLQFLFNLGMGLIFAPLVFKVNDIGNLLSFVLRFWMYGSAVFYSLDRFAAYPLLVAILELNPLYLVIDIMRDSLLYSITPSLQSWSVLTLWAVGALSVGFVLFWRKEESYGRAD